MSEKELLNTEECATLHGVSRSTWLRLADSGKAPWGVKLGRCRRWRRTELIAWLDAGCPLCDPRRTRAGVKE